MQRNKYSHRAKMCSSFEQFEVLLFSKIWPNYGLQPVVAASCDCYTIFVAL